MKRSASLLLIMSASAMGALAVHVTPEQALRRVTQKSANVPARVQKRVSAVNNYRLVDTRSAEGTEQLYLFEGDNGFLLLPADNEIKPVLGYGDGAALRGDGTVPDNFAYWLDFMSRRMAQALANPSLKAKADRSFGESREPIGPLCTTKWNQGAPYNNECPWDSKLSKTSVTGCVATATAQVMKYYNWPEKGYDSNSYTTRTRGWTLSTDFSDYTFDWDNMLDVYGSGATAEQNAAVAHLMSAVGRAMEMDYTADQSGAYSVQIANSLWKHFGYDNTIDYLMRDYYPLAKWEEIIYNNLRDYGPVIYDGQSPAGGHCFVCDGYNEEGLFHINWGWGGTSDGYFELDVLDPINQGIGGSNYDFNSNQDAIIGLRPYREGSQSTPNHFAMWAESDMTMSPLNTELSSGDSYSATLTFYNYGPFEIPSGFHVALAYQDMYNDKVLHRYIEISQLLPLRYGWSGLKLTDGVGGITTDGMYRVYMAIQSGNSDWSPVRIYNEYQPYHMLTIADGKVTINEMTKRLPEVMEIKYPDGLNLYAPGNCIDVTLRNYNSTDITESFRAELIRDGVVLAATDPVEITIPACDELQHVHWIGENLRKLGEEPAEDPAMTGERSGAPQRAVSIDEGKARICFSMLTSDGVYMPVTGGKELKLDDIRTGVTAVENDGVQAVEYYTLQGVRVAGRPAGPHIELRGGKMMKVIR